MTTIDSAQLMEAILTDHHGSIFLLWSGKRGAWWAPGGHGYTADRAEAGRFSFLIAIQIVAQSAYHGEPEQVTRMVWTPS